MEKCPIYQHSRGRNYLREVWGDTSPLAVRLTNAKEFNPFGVVNIATCIASSKSQVILQFTTPNDAKAIITHVKWMYVDTNVVYTSYVNGIVDYEMKLLVGGINIFKSPARLTAGTDVTTLPEYEDDKILYDIKYPSKDVVLQWANANTLGLVDPFRIYGLVKGYFYVD